MKGNELKYVTECIETGWVSSVGSYVDMFEKQFAEYIGTRYAVAVMNGTAALHISLLLSGVEPGDEVLVPNLTFVATVNAVRYCHANPVFMDSNWENLGLDVDKLKDFIKHETVFRDGATYNRKTSARIRAVVPMHTVGYPVDMDALNQIAGDANLAVIEDATESLGSIYKGKKTGSLSELACFSFNGNKIITTGGGGMITTNNESLAAKARHLTTTAKTDPVEFDHDQVGYNYRLVNVLAAIGVAQLEQIDDFVETKRRNLDEYERLIQGSGKFLMHTEPSYCKSNYWMYCLVINDIDQIPVSRVIEKLGDAKIQARPLWKLMNTLPMFSQFQSYHCETSIDIKRKIVNIPCSTGLTSQDLNRVAEVLNSI